MENKEIKLSLNIGDLENVLDACFTPDGRLVKEAVLHLLSDDQDALGIIFKASLGIHQHLEDYEIGEVVAVKYYNISSWNHNKDLMKEHGTLWTDGNTDVVRAKIIGFEKWNKQPVRIEYTRVDKDTAESIVTTEFIKESHIVRSLNEDWPEDLV